MSHWHDTLVDRPETDGGVYMTGWTISGLATLAVILAVWCLRFNRPEQSPERRSSGVSNKVNRNLRNPRSG
jgi:hypothetical protein